MKAWTSKDHDTMYPVGGCSIVVAETEEQARELLSAALREGGLNPEHPAFTLQPVDLTAAHATVLLNGDY